MRCSAVIAIVVLGLTCAAAQKVKFGRCRDVPVKADFDLRKYTGLWYEIEKTPVPFEAELKCVTTTYEDKGDHVSVLYKGVKKTTGEENTIEGTATIPDPTISAKLKVQFRMPSNSDYWILDTDYENYSLVYSCVSVLRLFRAEYVWIFSRQPTLDDATKEKLNKILDKNNIISRRNQKPTVQDCA